MGQAALRPAAVSKATAFLVIIFTANLINLSKRARSIYVFDKIPQYAVVNNILNRTHLTVEMDQGPIDYSMLFRIAL